MDTLKITECRRRSKFDLTHLDFNNMVIEVVNNLLIAFVGGIIFILAPLDLEIPDASGKLMDGMNKIMTNMLGALP